jgi:hypothetical protein
MFFSILGVPFFHTDGQRFVVPLPWEYSRATPHFKRPARITLPARAARARE